MNRLFRGGAMALLMVGCGALLASSAEAQDLPRPAIELSAGLADFEDSNVNGWMVGGSARVYVTPRLSVGPEIAFMTPMSRNLLLTGNLWFDLLDPTSARLRPYLVVGGGISRRFSHTEGGFTGGGGLRIPLGASAYIAPEARIAELHLRASAIMQSGPRSV